MAGGKRAQKRMPVEKVKRHVKQHTGTKLFFSVVSLFLVIAVFITCSFSWFSIKTSKIDAARFTLQCGKGLRVNDSGTSDFQMNEDQDRYIVPASSVDGRNLYFPTDGSDFSNVTKEMTFRNSNVGDKNYNYIQIDFSLTAQQNNTALYINEEKTSLQLLSNGTLSTAQAAPLRMAIWSSVPNSEGLPAAPVVFNPTGKTYTTAAVENVDRATGKITGSLGRQVSHAFSDYSYGGTPVATLAKGVVTKISVIIWLEGADPKCTKNRVALKDVALSLAFSTSWDKTQVIRFKDSTNGNWAGGLLNAQSNGQSGTTPATHSLTLRYVNPDDATDVTDFTMYKYQNTSDEWFCNMPGDMQKDITFILTPKSGTGTTYTFCKNSKAPSGTASSNTYVYYSYDRGVNRVYVAQGGNSNAQLCQGYWMDLGDSNGGGHDDNDIDGDDF